MYLAYKRYLVSLELLSLTLSDAVSILLLQVLGSSYCCRQKPNFKDCKGFEEEDVRKKQIFVCRTRRKSFIKSSFPNTNGLKQNYLL
jgi:hypothetical protein